VGTAQQNRAVHDTRMKDDDDSQKACFAGITKECKSTLNWWWRLRIHHHNHPKARIREIRNHACPLAQVPAQRTNDWASTDIARQRTSR
jgi:hypothetical protein